RHTRPAAATNLASNRRKWISVRTGACPARARNSKESEVAMSVDRSHAMDHVVLVLFENRSLDNVLGHLYGPQDGKTFEGVIGKELTNPIPEWAEHGAERKLVP